MKSKFVVLNKNHYIFSIFSGVCVFMTVLMDLLNIVACLLGNATVISGFRLGNSIYWILTVITAAIHFTNL
jgi:hypothetical protein